MNCCLTFLLYNFIAGVFVFLILGIFAVTNNPFLIIMNLKEKDGKKEYNSDERKHALLQYFIAAIFSLFFGFIIWYIPKLKDVIKGKKNKTTQIKKEMQIFNDNKDKEEENNERLLDESNNSSNLIEENNNNNDNKNNEEINTANTNEKFSINKTSTENDLGMTEKLDY